MTLRAPFWVEVLDRHNAVVSRQRVHAEAMTIGRAYENDLIVDDPFVAPLHLKIGYDEEGVLWIEDLASTASALPGANRAHGAEHPPGAPLPTDAAPQPGSTRMRVDHEAAIRIGHTSLRVRTAAFTVPPALSIADHRHPGAGYVAMALLGAAAFVLLSLLSIWLSQTTEFKLAGYLPEGLILPLVVMAWAGSWALMTRIITTQAQFFRHVFIAFAILLGLFFLDVIADFLAYSMAWLLPQRWLPVASWAMLGLLCFAHIAVITPRHMRQVGGIIGALVVLAMGTHLSLRIESDRVQAQRIAAQLMPPFLLLKSPATPDAFFKQVDTLRPKLEEARKKEPTAGGLSFDDFD